MWIWSQVSFQDGDERVSTGEIGVAPALKVSRNLTVSSRAISKPWQGNCLGLQLQRLKPYNSVTRKDSWDSSKGIIIYKTDISYMRYSIEMYINKDTVIDNQYRTNHPNLTRFASSVRVKWLDLAGGTRRDPRA